MTDAAKQWLTLETDHRWGKPGRVGEWAASTNGHAIVAALDRDGSTPMRDAEACKALLRQIEPAVAPHERTAIAMDKLRGLIGSTPCSVCHGVGGTVCPDCFGRPRRSRCDACGDEHECKCPSCESGMVPCPTCKHAVVAGTVRILHETFDMRLVLRSIPSWETVAMAYADLDKRCIYLSGDGWCSVLMAVRTTASNVVVDFTP